MSDSSRITYLPVEQAARMLGVRPPQVKQLDKDNLLLLVKTDAGLAVPEKMLQDLCEPNAVAVLKPDRPASRADRDDAPPAATHGPLWNLRGTITLLRDGGLSSAEILEWLWQPHPALGGTPIDALRAGLHHRVNNEASTVGF